MDSLTDNINISHKSKYVRKKSFNLEKMKNDFLNWLAQLKFPASSEAVSWEDCLQVFPEKNNKSENKLSGLKIRLCLKLFTSENRYLISIMECLDADAKDVYILTTHVNWKDQEWHIQKILDQTDNVEFKDVLKAKHTIWAQTFREHEMHEALNSSLIAIMGNELVGEHNDFLPKEIIKNPLPIKTSFPKQQEED